MSNKSSDAKSGSGTESFLQNIFEKVSKRRIITNHELLNDENLIGTDRLPVLNEIFHRNIRSAQIERLGKMLSCLLGGRCPSNMLIYGPSGAGKSVTCMHVLSTLASMCKQKKIPFRYFYIDLTSRQTCFGALNVIGRTLNESMRLYRKGIALNHMQSLVIDALSSYKGIIGIVVDEVDNIVSDGDAFYAFLAKTLPLQVNAQIFYIFLTNRVEWDRTIDPRILSVLKKTDVIFEPYDALDLVEILNLRVEKSLDRRKVDKAAIKKIAAYASRENGDARKAIELLSKSASYAEETSGRLGIDEVDEAEQLLEVDKTAEMIKSLAHHQKISLAACYQALGKEGKRLTTGQVYEYYGSLCDRHSVRRLTQRRFSHMISFLDIYGLINARVVTLGRYGKTREISGSLPEKIIHNILNEELW